MGEPHWFLQLIRLIPAAKSGYRQDRFKLRITPFSEMTDRAAIVIDELNDAGIRFLITDLDVALPFLDMTLLASDDQHRKWLCRYAIRAHDTVIYFLPRLYCYCSQAQKAEIIAKLSRIQGRLKKPEYLT